MTDISKLKEEQDDLLKAIEAKKKEIEENEDGRRENRLNRELKELEDKLAELESKKGDVQKEEKVEETSKVKARVATPAGEETEVEPEEPIDTGDDELAYFYPLPVRDSVFIPVEFNVLLEMKKIAKGNDGDWDSPSDIEESKYAKEINTIKYLIDNYDNIELQDSFNGYFYSKEEIIEGNFYL